MRIRDALERNWRALLSCTALFLLIGGGCGSGGSSGGDLLPSDEVARSAVDSALKAWRDGAKQGKLAGTEPPVEVHDSHWAKGEKLESYEILGEDSSTAEKKFSVRLSMAKPAGAQEVQYYVLGRGPVIVFRDEDYLRNMNMEEGPKQSRPVTTRRRN
jgi:hypothetical protein